MKRRTMCISLVGTLGVLVPIGAASAQMEMGTAFTYQGFLEEIDDGPVTGPCDFEFSLWDAESGGTELASTEIQEVWVLFGLFTVDVDFESDAFFSGDARWLGMAVCCPSYCTPLPLDGRQKLTPTPHALALPGLRTQQNATSPNLLGGHNGNIIEAGAVGATIGGGGAEDAPTAPGGKCKVDPDILCQNDEDCVIDNGSCVSEIIGGRCSDDPAIFCMNDDVCAPGTCEPDETVGTCSETFTTWCDDHGDCSLEEFCIPGQIPGTCSDDPETPCLDDDDCPEGTCNEPQIPGTCSDDPGIECLTDADCVVGNGTCNPDPDVGRCSGDPSILCVADPDPCPGLGAGVCEPFPTINRVISDVGAVSGGLENMGGDDGEPALRGPPPVFAVVAGGLGNTATARFSTVSGGLTNSATGWWSVVGGGRSNWAPRPYSAVGGGFSNAATGFAATIPGGYDNTITAGDYSVIAGGRFNAIRNHHSGILAGYRNTVWGRYSAVGGGFRNNVTDDFSVIAGGRLNRITNDHSGILAGYHNTVSGKYSAIGGGDSNQVTNNRSGILAGYRNSVSGNYSAILGGNRNDVQGDYSAIVGGSGNSAIGGGSFVGGGAFNRATGVVSTIGGGVNNVAAGVGSTIGGGGFLLGNTTGPGVWNATVGGGSGNTASGSESTVAGGIWNTASGNFSAIGGGSSNTASGSESTVPGGEGNDAVGAYSLAAGRRAQANFTGQFVWADSNAFPFPAPGEVNFIPAADQFLVRATGGVHIVTGIGAGGASVPGNGVSLFPAMGAWAPLSDRKSKENFKPVDTREVVRRLARIPIETWNYRGHKSPIRHMGPMAQDFYKAFGLGVDDRHIGTVDADGVALAAIQGLHEIVKEKDAKIAELEARLAALERAVGLDDHRAQGAGSAGPGGAMIAAALALLGLTGFMMRAHSRRGGVR